MQGEHGKCGFSEIDGCPFQRQESALTQGLQDHLGQQCLRPSFEKRWCELDPVACFTSQRLVRLVEWATALPFELGDR